MTLRGWYRTALGALLLTVAFLAEAQTAACPSGILSYRRSGAGQFNSANLCPTNAQPEEFRTCIETWANLPANSNRFGSRGPVTIRNASGFASSGSLEIWAYDYNSTQGTTGNYSFLNIAVNCGTCPAGSTRNATTGQCSAVNTCPASGTVMTTGRKSSKGIAQGNNQCYNGCQVTLSGSPIPRFTVSLEQLQGSGSFEDAAYTTVGNPGTQWIATGAECTTQPVVRDDGATVAGANATVGVKPNGCGEVNGEEFCASDLPAATNCAQSASGARVCGDSAPSPPVPIVPGTGSPAVPPSPENPAGTPAVPGTPAPPDAAMRADDGSGTTNNYNYYSSTTVNNGTTTGGTTSGGGTGGTTTGDSGGGVGSGGDCGASGQPKCGVTVDGTGITEFAGGQQFDAAFGDPLAAMNDTKSEAEAGSEGIGDAYGEVRSLFDALLPPSSTCQSIPLTYFGITRSIPGERGCQLLEGFKEIANYIILMVCAAGIVRKFSEIYATSKV